MTCSVIFTLSSLECGLSLEYGDWKYFEVPSNQSYFMTKLSWYMSALLKPSVFVIYSPCWLFRQIFQLSEDGLQPKGAPPSHIKSIM